MQTKTTLACEVCLSRNYHLKKNKFATERFELNKYCPTCKKVTVHKETR